MKPLFARLCVLGFLTLMAVTPPALAQTAERTAGPFSYDVGKEVTVSGTVSRMVKDSEPGMIAGGHLLVATATGEVDASLGQFAFRGNGALEVSAGEYVEVTGVMRTLKDRQVFVTRTVKVGQQVYVIRNEHGIAVSPQSRERASGQTTKGETL
ncbi:MAG: hypothetical protein WAN72_05735 [Candidatus Acidiferrales bacterium]